MKRTTYILMGAFVLLLIFTIVVAFFGPRLIAG